MSEVAAPDPEPMTPARLRAAGSLAELPAGAGPLLEALWHEAHGDWTRAHEIVQALDTPQAAAVHAYLHRREGDPDNARYWYARAGRAPAGGPLDAEWEALAGGFLARRA